MKNHIFQDKNVQLDSILNKKIAIIGYGNQGRAQALNLRDSGMNIKVGLRKNSISHSKVIDDGLEVLPIHEAVIWGNVICILVSDKEIPNVYNEFIHNNLKENDTVLFSHGYNVTYKLIIIPKFINVVMVAPSGGGMLVREEYLKKTGVPTLLAVEQDYSNNSIEIIKSYSKAIGGTRTCAFLSTFKEETETDIFGEQAILTGGLPYLINASYNTLIKNGYNKTVAWFVCYYEIKTIVDLFHKKGFEEFYNLISDTARYGGISRGDKLIDREFEDKLQNILNDIKSGSFNKEFQNFIDNKEFPTSFNQLELQTNKLLNFLKEKDK